MAQPPSVPNRDGGSRWLLACGVGCGALLLIVVLGIVASVTAIRYGMGEAVGEIRSDFANEYEQLQANEKIPEEHAEVFERIYVISQNEDTSFMSTMMGFFVIMAYLDDGEVSETEAESAAMLADHLEANPDMGIIGFAEFVENHPEFQGAFQDAQRNMQGMNSRPEVDSEVDFEAEEPESL
jgi:hypothetical protein